MEGRGRFCYTKNNVNYALNSFFHWKHCCSWDEKIQRGYPGGGGVGVYSGFQGTDILRDFVPTSTLHCIYNYFIQSQFDYSDIVWVIVEKLCLTGYRSFRTVLLVF